MLCKCRTRCLSGKVGLGHRSADLPGEPNTAKIISVTVQNEEHVCHLLVANFEELDSI